jgi:tetratricopeptide (TPR) repeat protein
VRIVKLSRVIVGKVSFIGFQRLVRAAVAAGAIAVQTAGVPVSASRAAAPPRQVNSTDVVLQVLSAVDRGERPGHVALGSIDAGDFSKASGAWVSAGPAPARERREQAVAAALLFVAYRAIDEPGPGYLRLRQFKVLVERQCARLRRDPQSEFARRWLIASLAFVEVSGDSQFFIGNLMPCKETRDGLCDHLSHVRSTFPNESLVRLIELSLQPFAIASRQPGELAGQLAVDRARPSPSSSASRGPSIARLESGLTSLLSDPMIGADARLRLGLLRYELNQRQESLGDLSRVVATSTSVEARVTAHYVSALIHDADQRPPDATRSLEEALKTLPGMRSIALAVATRYNLAGRVEDASALLDRTFAVDPPAFDPWRARYAAWTWYQAFDRLAEMFK